MRKLKRYAYFSQLNMRLMPLYYLKQLANNSRMPDDLKQSVMKWCDQEINKYWRWSHEGRRGYSMIDPTPKTERFHPMCPYGCLDCVNDPGYIYIEYPEYYKERYGDKTPWQAAEVCRERYRKEPDVLACSSYDDEDK